MVWISNLLAAALAVIAYRIWCRLLVLEQAVRVLNERHWADHELLMTVTTIAGDLNAIDALDRTGFREAADKIRRRGSAEENPS